MMRVRLGGADKVRAALRADHDRAVKGLAEAIDATAIEFRTAAIRAIQSGPKSGRTYRRAHPRRVHVASAPGQPPATDTGRLVSTIHHERIGPLSAMVSAAADYADDLEYGTRRMASRPFFAPLRPAAEQRLAELVAKVLAGIAT